LNFLLKISEFSPVVSGDQLKDFPVTKMEQENLTEKIIDDAAQKLAELFVALLDEKIKSKKNEN